MVGICLQGRRYRFDPWHRKIPLEKGMAAHSSILAWRIPWTSLAGYGPCSHKELNRTNTFTLFIPCTRGQS